VFSVNVDDLKVVENVHVPPKTASIIEDLSVGSGTPFFMRPMCLLIVPVMT